MSEKCTIIEGQQRVRLVEEMILKGCGKSYIVQFVSEKYNIGERQVENYLAKAREQIIIDFENTFDVNSFKSEVYGRLQDLYRKNYTIEDFRECRNIVKDLRDMLGLDKPKQTDITSMGEKIQNVIHLGSGINPNETTN